MVATIGKVANPIDRVREPDSPDCPISMIESQDKIGLMLHVGM